MSLHKQGKQGARACTSIYYWLQALAVELVWQAIGKETDAGGTVVLAMFANFNVG